jgi:hypothetical protein
MFQYCGRTYWEESTTGSYQSPDDYSNKGKGHPITGHDDPEVE